MIDHVRIEPSPDLLLAGALAHLARHMTTGCPRAGHLAAMLFELVANDPEASGHLRAHARELVDVLDRDAMLNAPAKAAGTRLSSARPAAIAVPEPVVPS